MVRILTAHRVFPAKVTGGNGIAGTSIVVPDFFKEYAHGQVRCNDIRLCIERWDLRWFRRRCDGRPRPVRGDARGVRREACACCSILKSRLPRRRIHPPSKEHFSCVAPLSRSDFDLPGTAMRLLILRSDPAMHFAGWMRQSSDVLLVVVETIAGVAGTTTLWVWIRFDSDGCLGLERV
jgi:hypothetical protein